MKALRMTALILLTCCVVPPLAASDFVVVTATGALEPEGLQTGQVLAEKTRVKLEPWGRALIRETTKCALTHVVIGVDDYPLTLAEDCAPTDEPVNVADRLQRGEVFAARLKETGSGPADQLVSALANEPCVFLPRVSEEGENVRRCPSGYALRGLRCSGKFCDDKDLLCCPYLDGAPDPTAKETNSRWVSEEVPNTLTTKKFFNGLTCRGPYCDDSFLHQFKSSRLVNTRECDWTPWYSEQNAPWLDCGLGRLMAGMRCMGDYCADVAVYCCQAKVE